MLAVFFAPFGLSLLALCLLERVLHVFVCIFFPGLGKKDDGKDSEGQMVVGGVLNLAATSVGSVASILARCVYVVGWAVFWFLLLFCVTSVAYVMYEEQPAVVLKLVSFYNARIGPFLHSYLLLPLEFLNLLFKGVIPVYNGAVWIVRTFFKQGLLPILWDQIAVLVDMAVALLSLGKHFSGSVVSFVKELQCDTDACLLDQPPPVLDIVTPMGDVRLAAVLASKMGGVVCSLLAVPIDLALYPLLDVNLAKGVHNAVNALMQLVVHVPRVTMRRCQRFGSMGTAYDTMMCTPDLEPVFSQLVAATRDFGALADNWLGLAAAMAGQTLSKAASAASKLTGANRRLLQQQQASNEACPAVATLMPETFRGDLLSGPMTVVGLADWLMAATNGTLAYFYGQVNTDVAPRAWPDKQGVDVRMGVAAVSFAEVGALDVSTLTQGRRPGSRQTTTMMGCRCEDGASGGIRVRCFFLPLSGAIPTGETGMDVWFQDQTWASQLTCASVEITVRSLRWPVRRYEGKSVPFGASTTEMPNIDCLTRGTCESVDATIWLVPRCDLLPAVQCSDVATGTSCFPFCMAARISGSRNANPVFVNAATWRAGKQILMRDCAKEVQTPAAAVNSFFLRDGGGGSTMSYGQTTLSGAAGDSQLFVRGDGSTCGPGVNMASWVPTNAAPDSTAYAYVRRTGQPFVIAGDSMLLEFPQSDGNTLVEVERLTGNQRDEYTLARGGWGGLLAAPKRLVPIGEFNMDVRDRIVVPMDYVATRVVATNSRNYVFYASNPDLQVFQSYLDYCRDRSNLPKVQVMALSSYAPLRVYRVRAYCQEGCTDLSRQYTFDSFSNGTFTVGSFQRDCGRVYNASIDSLEYVNEQNIAVVVQTADRTYNVATRTGSNSVYKTYWLNPQTMDVRNDTMWPTGAAAGMSLTTSMPCGVGDGIPHVGSLAAEVVASGVHLAHAVIAGTVSTPGLIKMWSGGGVCPLVSRGHSVLATCGEDVFSTVDFFDSLDDATAIFWGIPTWVSDQLDQGKVAEYSPVGNLMQGLSAYGKGTVGVLETQGGVMSLLNTPLPAQVAGMWALMRQPGSPAGAAKVAAGASSWARYSARFFTKLAVDMVKLALVSGGAIAAGEIWRRMMAALYDLRPYFRSSVTERSYDACLGLQVMMGGANPWGRLLYHGCKGSSALMEGAMDLVIHLFVDAPMVKCVCKDSATHDVAKYTREYCVPKAPVTLRPTLLGMVSAAQGLAGASGSLLCETVISYTRDKMGGTMSPWFASTYAMLDAVGDSVDFMLSGFDEDAGQCVNFRQDPQVVVIMPEPVDYFQGCASTTSCKTKCAGTWGAFSAEAAKRNPLSLTGVKTIEQSVESLFFPSPGVDIVAPGKILAMTEPPVCGLAVCRAAADGCVATASIVGGSKLSVLFYCIPKSPSASVYTSDNSNALNWESATGGAATQVGFVGSDGTAMAALIGTDKVYLLRKGMPDVVALDTGSIYSLLLQLKYPLRIVDFMPVQDRLLVNVAVRTSSGGQYERSVSTVWLDPASEAQRGFPAIVTPDMSSLWSGFSVSEYPGSEAGSVTLLMWPSSTLGSMQRLMLRFTNTSIRIEALDVFNRGNSLAARATLTPKSLVLSKTLRLETGGMSVLASTGNTYDWLQMLRLTGQNLDLSGGWLGNSQTVQASVEITTGCDGLDCRGCPDMGLRALCSSFQSCSIFRCIGTPVNLKRPLCGIGQTLRSTGVLAVEMVQGGWVMFVDVYMILLQLTTQRNVPGVEVTFPDDAFLGNVCAAKDLVAEFFSIITSTMNSALQFAQIASPVLLIASNVDSNANTMLSLSTAAVTGFMSQVTLFPVYGLAVAHKILMCKVNGLVAVSTSQSFKVQLQSAKFSATNAISGVCMTAGVEAQVAQTGDPSAVKSIGTKAGEILSSTGGTTALEPVMHLIDGVITYFIGVAGKTADMVQTFDLKNCLVPDVTLKQTVRCACGDRPLEIIPARRREGLAEHAKWCTGTLSLVDSSNRMRVVWNPYTYQELQAKLTGVMDAYVEQAGVTVSVKPPNDEVFAKQGVSIMAVLTRCRQNYVNEQWDPAAYARYDQNVLDKELTAVSPHPTAADSGDGVGACLLDSAAAGVGNGACLDAFLMSKGVSASSYWAYQQSNVTASNLIDACVVFSGPAENKSVSPERRKVYQDCLSGYDTPDACDLSGFVWSPASSNNVPVAARHVIMSTESTKVDAVAQRMWAARDSVLAELDKIGQYANDQLESAIFSAEGDVIHQLLDCIFMGPFARVDYWPGPRCNESETPDCLVGPYWSRDEGSGGSRKVNIETCAASDTLPFTCGSPTRHAMVRYFVKEYLQAGQSGTKLLEQLVNEWLAQQRQLWRNVSNFGCDCPKGSAVANDVRCCTQDVAKHLPASLAGLPLHLPTQGIMNAIETRARLFYAESLKASEPWLTYLTSEEHAKYDWNASAGAHRVESSALYDATNQSRRFTKEEAMSPLKSAGLWETCHAALKQVMFTMPVGDDGLLRDAVPGFSGGGPDAIAAHVKALVQSAYESSPLYRHYQPRHHPSESRMCDAEVGAAGVSGVGQVSFGDYRVKTNLILDSLRLSANAVIGMDASPLGAWNQSCFCGWGKSAAGRCSVPAAVCAVVSAGPMLGKVAADCTYLLSAQDRNALEAAYQAGGSWPCPLLALSEHLGFLDPDATELWLRGGTNLTTSGEFLLRYGPGGLKVGNAPVSDSRPDLGLGDSFSNSDLGQVLSQYLMPGQRRVDPSLAVLHGCQEFRRKDESSLLVEFAEGLFPMAQGVTESGVGAYCLRFAIELAMLRAMELMAGASHEKMVQQKEAVAIWRRRCGTQVQLVGMCSALDIYRSIGVMPGGCTERWQIALDSSRGMYVTSECLVSVDGVFYDPCVCNPSWCSNGSAPVLITVGQLADSCRLGFDPRTVVRSAELGWWGLDEADPSASASNTWLEEPWNLLDLEALKDSLLGAGRSVGNSPVGRHWATAEGFMNETGMFCDMIADYWPDDAIFPVGYHATVPCDQEDAGYRTFDNVFARDTDQSGNPRMVYMEDQTRDGDLVDSHFGAGGLCRGTNFGFDMYETNTMRVCTRASQGEDVDVHVPRGANDPGTLGLPRCSESSTDLPWGDERYYDYYDAAFYSVGTVPNLPSGSANVYPETADRYMRIGPQHDMETGRWGGDCQDFDIPQCGANWRCPDGYVCKPGGVCQHSAVECTKHSDCAAGGKMCSGVGTCVTPRVTVENQLGVNASFRAHATDCAGEAFSMRGGSPWGFVPDLLDAHGMCSYRHWQEYKYTLDRCTCAPGSTSDACLINGTQCPFYTFSMQDSNNMWWDAQRRFPARLKMLPTTCDRNYERFTLGGREMQSCVPGNDRLSMVGPDKSYKKYAARDTMWKTYNGDTKTVAVRRMPFLSSSTFGFLGFSAEPTIKSCTSVQQCFVDVFTKNGAEAMVKGAVTRPDRTIMGGAVYNPDHTFRCGVIGYFNGTSGMCHVDRKLFPIYSLMCFGSAGVTSCLSALSISESTLINMCQAVQDPYPQQYKIIHDVNIPALTALFEIFSAPATLQAHFNTVKCMNFIYGAISKPPYESKGLYVPFTFTVYEIPFPWFYQCMVGSRLFPADTFSKLIYKCVSYESRFSVESKKDAKMDLSSYVVNVRAGYNDTALAEELTGQMLIAQRIWRESVEQVRQSLFLAGSDDRTYPVCYTERRWDIPNTNFLKLRLIETFERPSCADNVRSKYFNQFKESVGNPKGLNLLNVVDELTVYGVNKTMQTVTTKPMLTKQIGDFGADHVSGILTKKATFSMLLSDKAPVAYDYSMPSIDSIEYTTQRMQWRLLGGYMPYASGVSNPGTVLCSEDQKYLYKGSKYEKLDSDQMAGVNSNDPWVKVCPLYATGLFGCHYEDITIDGTTTSFWGNDTNPEASFEAYVDALYGKVKRVYDSRMAEEIMLPKFSPKPLAFFTEESSLHFGANFMYDLTNVSRYMGNIDPDVKNPVMCTAGNQTIDYSECTDANFEALRQHVKDKYVRNSSVIVPDGMQMDWDVSGAMLTAGAIFSYAAVPRDVKYQYLGKLFDKDTVCQAMNLPHSQRLCSFTQSGSLGTGRSVSPWMSGGWNPYDQCDVVQLDADNGNTEKIDVECHYASLCPPERGIDTVNVQYYKDMPYKDACKLKQDQKTTHLNVEATSPYNLCRHMLKEDSICLHNQGMLGGTDGLPVDDAPVDQDLFALSEFSQFPAGDGEPFGNVLLSGKNSSYGFVRVPWEHIGGHHLALSMSGGYMRVTRLPLKPVADNLRVADWDSLDVKEWVESWNSALENDEAVYLRAVNDVGYVVGVDSQNRPLLGWSCPLKRRAFYTGGVSGFGPSLPSARRSRRLFGNLTKDRHAHPTQARTDASGQFGRYLATNGFCFCPMSEEVWPGMCSVQTELTNEHNCSLHSTVRAIKGEAWGWSHTFRPKTAQNEYKTCSVQVDWPFVRGTLRDGGELLDTDVSKTAWDGASDVEARRCHVLDRVPDFAYVYASKRELKPSGFTTLDRGVCHTGRAQARAASNARARCVRVAKGNLDATVRCMDNRNINVNRKTSKLAGDAAKTARFRRKPCSQCTPPPTFSTRGGVPIKPESSFGVPYRVSAERVLAQDLRRALCGENQTCVAKLNASAWSKGEFMRTYLKNPRGLFAPGAIADGLFNASMSYVPKSSQQPDDKAMWAKPWVYCPTKEALETGVGCLGSIEKARWRKEKVHACYSTLEGVLKGAPDPMAKTQVCEIDSTLTGLCKAIREAQSLVASANCLASGSEKCALQEFVYSPATWETSNQAFVHQTVEEYYKRADAGCVDDHSCICGTDPALAALRVSNANTVSECSATSVILFQKVLIAVRAMLLPLTRCAGLVVNIALNLVLTMVPATHDVASSQIITNYHQLKTEMSSSMDQFSDLVFEVAFTSGRMGPWMLGMLTNACNTINTGYIYFANFWCNLLIHQLPVFLASLKSIGGWIDVGFGVVNDIFTVILQNYLPNAIMDLYQMGYNQYYQSNKYKEKQATYEKRVQADLGNPKQGGELTPEERQKKALEANTSPLMDSTGNARVAGTATSIAKSAIGVVAQSLSFGIIIYDTVQQIQTAMKIAEVLKDFPTSFTLFDFESFYEAIDTLLAYINADLTCYSMNTQAPPLQCVNLRLPEPNASDLTAKTRASPCWAEVQQQQVGVSNLYACGATSTCCPDPLNCDDSTKTLMCGNCPLPALAGIRTFGCNTMIQKCQCGLESYEVDRCVAQRECGATSSCSLLASLDDISFGAMKSCTDCTSSPICLVGGSQHYGQCTCLNSADAKVALCDTGVGSQVRPEASKLCGYAQDSGTYFAWSELSLVLCINAVLPTCSEVVTESGATIYMPVATQLRGIQVSYGGRRRLLEDHSAFPNATTPLRFPRVFSPEDPADDLTQEIVHRIVTESQWNHTSAPCATLAHAYRIGAMLGPVDEATLHSCVYWRIVGKQVISEYKMQSLENLDSFLLSPDDLSAAIGQKGVLGEFLQKPQALLVASMYSPWLKPLRAALVASHNANVSSMISGWARRISQARSRQWRGVKNKTVAEVVVDAEAEFERGVDAVVPKNARARFGGRRLLGIVEDAEAEIHALPFYPYVKAMAANFSVLSLASDETDTVGYAVAQSWLRESFSWHPMSFQGTCTVADAAVGSVAQVLMVVQKYYEHFLSVNAPRILVKNRLRDAIPTLKTPVNYSLPGVTLTSPKTTGAKVFDWGLGVAGMSQADLIGFLTDPCPGKTCAEANRWTLTYLVDSYLYCNFETVMYCGAYKRGLMTSILFSVILFVLVYYVLSYIGLSIVGAMLFAALPLFVLWFSIGVAPSCLPMLPTCLFDDVLDTAKAWIPPTAVVPPMLLVNNKTSLRSCTDLKFTSWEDSIVFTYCDMGFCDGQKDVNLWGIARLDFAQKQAQIESPDADAYRVCSVVSVANSVPAFIAFTLGLALVASVAMAGFSLVGPFVFLMWQVVVYNHKKTT
jgi:hypothetical protein